MNKTADCDELRKAHEALVIKNAVLEKRLKNLEGTNNTLRDNLALAKSQVREAERIGDSHKEHLDRLIDKLIEKATSEPGGY